MKPRPDAAAELGRITDGLAATRHGDPSGLFRLVHPITGAVIEAHLATENDPELAEVWETLTVRGPRRPPTIEELDWIVPMFFQPTERCALFLPTMHYLPDAVQLVRLADGNLPEPPSP